MIINNNKILYSTSKLIIKKIKKAIGATFNIINKCIYYKFNKSFLEYTTTEEKSTQSKFKLYLSRILINTT